MKRFVLFYLVVFVFCVSCFGDLVKTTQNKGYITGETFISEGWVDDNTFRVMAIGFSKESISNKLQRRITSKESASMAAQKIVVERFKGMRISGSSSSKEGIITEMLIKKQFDGVIRGGAIVKETYDEADNCEIVYEITSPGLKERVTAGIR